MKSMWAAIILRVKNVMRDCPFAVLRNESMHYAFVGNSAR